MGGNYKERCLENDASNTVGGIDKPGINWVIVWEEKYMFYVHPVIIVPTDVGIVKWLLRNIMVLRGPGNSGKTLWLDFNCLNGITCLRPTTHLKFAREAGQRQGLQV